MKLQAKFTITFILLVIVTTVISFLVINVNLQQQFEKFIRDKNRQWEQTHNPNMTPLENPFILPPRPEKEETPEQNFVRTAKNSLLFAGIIDISLAVILAYILSNFLLKRIYRLKSSMHQYMEDGTSRPVTHGEEDEIDELATIYNELIEKIQREEKVRKEFFIDMSHELRTPLTSVKGYLEGLIDKVFDAEKEKDIHQKALGETDRMIHLIKEMTILAKLESEKPKLTFKRINLRTLTEEVAEMLKPEFEKKGIRLTINGEAEAKIDDYKFRQVLINLTENALQYTKGKTIDIEIGQKNGGAFWKIQNKTEGTHPEDVEQFFERFYRGDKSRVYEKQKPHLGIGLNIVKKIVEQHRGSITANLKNNVITFEIVLR